MSVVVVSMTVGLRRCSCCLPAKDFDTAGDWTTVVMLRLMVIVGVDIVIDDEDDDGCGR